MLFHLSHADLSQRAVDMVLGCSIGYHNIEMANTVVGLQILNQSAGIIGRGAVILVNGEKAAGAGREVAKGPSSRSRAVSDRSDDKIARLEKVGRYKSTADT